ncbi:MAG: hypothetical protein KDK25_13990 [Leptospiraceae bacterium]|nr:hypothetical protein [Leptospiraceae bacterium]MCB1171451.1 hypothetical protein [Leptospiraceae bacterium]
MKGEESPGGDFGRASRLTRGAIFCGFVIASLILSACSLAKPAVDPVSSKQAQSRKNPSDPGGEAHRKNDDKQVGRPIRLFGRQVTIDRFERSPSSSGSSSTRGGLPFHGISYARARKICQLAEARLCSVREWQRACQLARSQAGHCFKADSHLPSGARCAHAGLQDMSTNFPEWAALGPSRRPAIVGLSSRCGGFRLESASATRLEVSVRCCK